MLALGWRRKVVEGGLEGEANPHEGEATSSSRNNWLVAGDAVSVTSARSVQGWCTEIVAGRPRGRHRCRCRRSSCPMKKGDHGAFDPKIFPTVVTLNSTRVHTLLVVSSTRGTHAYWKRVGVAPDQLVVAVLQGRCSSQVVSLTARMR